jgi:hypothetical protein
MYRGRRWYPFSGSEFWQTRIPIWGYPYPVGVSIDFRRVFALDVLLLFC